MQTTTNPVERQATQPQFIATAMPVNEAAWAQYHIIRRNGAVVNFEPSKIGIAMTKAFLAVNGGQGAAMHKAMLLRKLGLWRERDFNLPRCDARHLRAEKPHQPLLGETGAEAIFHHANGAYSTSRLA